MLRSNGRKTTKKILNAVTVFIGVYGVIFFQWLHEVIARTDSEAFAFALACFCELVLVLINENISD